MTHYAAVERAALCDTFLRVGPDAPTLCGDWTTAELATHLIVRQGRPDLTLGSLLPIVGGHVKSVVKGISTRPWPELVESVRRGPPAWTPLRFDRLDELANLVEYYVHHEDVLRAVDASARRDLPQSEQRALWGALRRSGKLMFRRAKAGAELVSDHGTFVAKSPTARGSVVLRGTPGELLLAAYGRQRVADLEVDGEQEAVDALWSSTLGFG